MITPEECYYIGYIRKPHALKGEVVLVLDVDHPNSYKKKESVLLMINNELIPFSIERVSIKGNLANIKFKGIDRIEEGEKLVGTSVYALLSDLPKLKGKKQFYFHEIIGFKVVDSIHGEVGIIKDVVDNGHQYIFQITSNSKEILVPVIDEFLLEVNKEDQSILLNTPDGLIDLYLKEL